MTAQTVLLECDALRPNAWEKAQKLLWLKRLDAQIRDAVPAGIDFPEEEPFTAETELLLPDAYGDVYVKYLISQMDYASGEFGRYNASAALFNEVLDRAMDALNRRRVLPKERGMHL